MGTLALLQAAKEYWQPLGWEMPSEDGDAERVPCRFYHISTDEVYGALGMNCPEGVKAPFHYCRFFVRTSGLRGRIFHRDHKVRSA